jgi:hypothetical protein
MSYTRKKFIDAFRLTHGGTEAEVDAALRQIELNYAAQQNAELLEALDAADGKHLRNTEKLRADLDEWKTHEAAARGACMTLAQMYGHFGSELAHLQAGQYDEALRLIMTREERRRAQRGPTVVSIVAVEDNYGRLDCCDEETAHVWVEVLTWSGRRAYLTGISPFMEAAKKVWGKCSPHDLRDARFTAELPLTPPGAKPEPGERLEWPGLELCPPTEEIKARLGIG